MKGLYGLRLLICSHCHAGKRIEHTLHLEYQQESGALHAGNVAFPAFPLPKASHLEQNF
jgi:hypothetical protein